MQERLNAVQEELKLVVANAELARSHAMTVLRKQAQLKEVRLPAPLYTLRILRVLRNGLGSASLLHVAGVP